MMFDATASLTAAFAAEVSRDLALTPKQLQSKYLYDPLGSSLFEAICRLPWYRITRAESRLLRRHAADIVGEFGGGTIVELGCGSGEKIMMLAEVLQARYAGQLARIEPKRFPHARDIARLALPRFAAGETCAADDVAPVYIRNKVALRSDERASR